MCARLPLQTDAAFPFSEQDRSRPGLFPYLLMSESPFRSRRVLVCMFTVTIYYLTAYLSRRGSLSRVADAVSKKVLGRNADLGSDLLKVGQQVGGSDGKQNGPLCPVVL